MANTKRLDLILGAKDRSSKTIGGVGRALGGLKTKILALGAALGAGLSIGAVVQFTRGSVAAFMEQEQAVQDLTTALMLAGDETASGLPKLREFASELQAVTTQGDEATLKLAAYVSQLGNLSGDALQSATAATLGLARATGQGQEIMARAYLNALEGNFTSLQRYVPALRSATTEQEKMAIVQGLASKGLTLMGSDAQTTRGAVQQMRNSWGDFREMIGSKVAPMIVSLSGKVKGFVERNGPAVAGFIGNLIQKVGHVISVLRPKLTSMITFVWGIVRRVVSFMLPVVLARLGVVRQLVLTVVDVVMSAGRAVVGVIRSIFPSMGKAGDMMTKLRDFTTRALITIEYGLKNWRQVVELAMLASALDVVKFANQVTYFFTSVIPDTLKWLGNNWSKILTDLMNLTATMFSNMAGNIVRLVRNIPGLISGSVDFSDIWTPITEGFTATLTELPRIAAREEGNLERALREQVEEIGGGLAGGYREFMSRRLREIGEQSGFLEGLFEGGSGRGFFARLSDKFKGQLDLGSLIDQGNTPELAFKLKKPPKGSAQEEEIKSVVQQQIGVDALQISRQFLGIASLAGSRAARPQEQTATNTGSLVGLMRRMISTAERQVDAIKDIKPASRHSRIKLAF